MDDPRILNKLPVISILLILLIWLLSLPAQNLFEISPETYKSIGEWLGYKRLLNISWSLLIIVVTLTILYFSKHPSHNKTTEQTFLPKESNQPTHTSIAPYSVKISTQKPTDYIKFHTVNGVTFKFNSSSGDVYAVPFCSKDPIPIVKQQYYFDAKIRDYVTVYKCPVCGKTENIGEEKFKQLHSVFKTIVKSYIDGFLKDLPKQIEL